MSSFKTRTTLATSLAALGLALAPAPAHANTACEATSDCPNGYLCTVVGGGTCAVGPCEPGQECAPTNCTSTEIKECRPGATCVTDADCASDLKCITNTSSACTGGMACSKDGSCTEMPSTCTTRTTSSCLPRYIAPCEVDADCGDGFRCEAEEECTCWASGAAGGVGTGGSMNAGIAAPRANDGAGAAAGDTGSSVGVPTPAPDSSSGCSCKPTEHKRCQAILKDCVDASECPTGWSCQQTATVGCAAPTATTAPPEPSTRSSGTGGNATSGPVSGGTARGGATSSSTGGGGSVGSTPDAVPMPAPPPGAGASTGSGGSTGRDVPTTAPGTGGSIACPPPPSKQCVPPNYYEYGSGTLAGGTAPKSAGTGGSQGTSTAIDTGSDDNSHDVANAWGDGTTPADPGTRTGTSPSSAGAGGSTGVPLDDHRGGISCQLGDAPAAAGAGAWLAMLGLVGLVSRRRREVTPGSK